MNRYFDRLFGSTVDYPLFITTLIILITIVAAIGLKDPEILLQHFRFEQPRVDTNKPDNKRPQSDPVPDIDAVSLSDADAILVVIADDFFTKDASQAINEVVDSLNELPHVKSILWMENAPVLNLFGFRESVFPNSRASVRQFEAARKEALGHPLVGGQLLSSDGKTLLLMIKFDWLYVTSDAHCTSILRETAEAALARHSDVEFKFLLTGMVPGYLTFIEAQQNNRFLYQTIGYGSIILMALILFRGIRAVMIVALGPVMGVFWTLGIINYFGFQDNPFNDIILPVLLSLIGLTDSVHLLVEIRKRRAEGVPVFEAARGGICSVGLACALTSLTTAIGFGSLSLAHHEIVREFGMCCVIGVFLTFLAVVLLIPLVCSSRLGRNIHHGVGKGLIDRNLAHVGSLVDSVLNHSKTFSGIAMASTLILSLVSFTLKPDEKRSDTLPLHSEFVQAMQHMDVAFQGLEIGQVNIRWSEQISDDSPEILDVIEKAHQLLLQEELLGAPLSLNSLLKALPGDGPVQERMPLVELLPPPLKRGFITPERRETLINFRVQDLGIATYGPVFERLLDEFQEIEQAHPEFELSLSGSAVWRWENLYQIVVDLAASLGTAIVIIFLVLTMAYRSLRIGLISIVPNLFPLAITGTFLVISGQSLEIASVCAFTVCLGIAVDDTIHFLTRYTEQVTTQSSEDAVRTAFTGTGTALIMTTVVLMVGFFTVLMSDMRDQRIFAAMGLLTISSALFADLIFLPALLIRFARKSQPSSADDLPQSTEQSESLISPE